ncbi:hypothetical protein SUGI_0681610 [Cryptomeria japonica]|nr:hypothetical protein SUGI_0681610 [Cryptomeria japonica]
MNGHAYDPSSFMGRAYALRDVVTVMLSQMDPALVVFCYKIVAQRGPTHLSEDSTTDFPSNHVAQPVHITRASEFLCNIHPDMNVSQSYEVLKCSKHNSDPFVENGSQVMEIDNPGHNTLKM